MNSRLYFVIGLLVLVALPFGYSDGSIDSSKDPASYFEDDDLLWDRNPAGGAPEAETGIINNRYCDGAEIVTEGPNTFDNANSDGQVSNFGCFPAAYNSWYKLYVPILSKKVYMISGPAGTNISLFSSCRQRTISKIDCGLQYATVNTSQYAGQYIYINVGWSVKGSGALTVQELVVTNFVQTIITITLPSVQITSRQDLVAAIARLLNLDPSQYGRINIISGISDGAAARSTQVISFTISPSLNPSDPSSSSLTLAFISAIGTNTTAFYPYVLVLPITTSNSTITINIPSFSYVSQHPRCFTDSDCNSGKGKCVFNGCACYSGFGDPTGSYTCSAQADDSCFSAASSVSGGSSSFTPSYSVDVVGGNMVFTVTMAVQQSPFTKVGAALVGVDADSVGHALDTEILWTGVDLSSQCNYPSTDNSGTPLWVKAAPTAGSCNDTYVLTVPWSLARSQCGFAYDVVSKTWRREVTIQRAYSIPFNDTFDARRSVLPRTERLTFDVSVKFPETVVIESNTTVSGPQAVQVSAVSNVIYVAATDSWRIDVQTYTGAPYHLELDHADFPSRVISSNISTNVDGCGNNSVGCKQVFTAFIAGCAALQDSLTFTVYAKCNVAGATCPVISASSSITASLWTQSSCNQSDTIEVQTKTISSFKRSSMLPADAATSFKAQQTAYFSANIASTDATIYNRTLISVCMAMDGGSTCTPVTFGLVTSPGSTQDPAFSVYLGQTRLMTTDDAPHVFTIRATIGLTWTDATARRSVAHVRNSVSHAQANIQLLPDNFAEDAAQPQQATTQNDAAQTSTNTWKLASIGLMSVLGAAIVAVVIAVFIAHRRGRVNTTQQI